MKNKCVWVYLKPNDLGQIVINEPRGSYLPGCSDIIHLSLPSNNKECDICGKKIELKK